MYKHFTTSIFIIPLTIDLQLTQDKPRMQHFTYAKKWNERNLQDGTTTGRCTPRAQILLKLQGEKNHKLLAVALIKRSGLDQGRSMRVILCTIMTCLLNELSCEGSKKIGLLCEII